MESLASTVSHQLPDENVYTFSRVTPTILSELASYARGIGAIPSERKWLRVEDALDLLDTIEGMRWVAYRCASEHTPGFQGARGRARFESLTDDFGVLASLIAAIANVGDEGSEEAEGSDPPAEPEGPAT